MSNVWEYLITEEMLLNGYDEHGDCIGQPEFIPPSPKRIAWDLKSPECISAIKEADANAQILINDIHLRIYVHDRYGKGLMKKCQLSPDAFIQMALQLAYYRDAGRFSLTYEASMTRLFREGRTETVRPISIQSADWVKSMLDETSTNEKRIELLRTACQQHQLVISTDLKYISFFFTQRAFNIHKCNVIRFSGLSRCNVRQRNRSSSVLFVRCLKIFGSRFSIFK